ncbi:MAG: ketoacyl-ACP synthase III [Planctomycetia bacterium]|nr:ketoacyl-ACP synthase III [Planctomycetia bacterium]
MSDVVIQSPRSPLRQLCGVQVLGTGSFVPPTIVRNEDLASLGYDADWILQRTGIRERRHAGPEMATSDMAIAAATRCLEQAGAKPSEVDLVVVGTFTPDMPAPATACLVQDRLGIAAPAFDVQAACAGFLYSLVVGMQFVASGNSRRALVIGADTNSRIANPADMKTYPLFGDGAGAVLLGAGEPGQGLVSYTLGADGSGQDLLCRKMGGSRFPTSLAGLDRQEQFLRMEGRPIFKWAIRLVEQTVRDVLAEAHKTIDDIDLLVLHQANIRIMYGAADNLGVPRDKVLVNIDKYGNTSAASVPLALDEAHREGRIRRGSLIMLSGFGAGLAWGTALLKW